MAESWFSLNRADQADGLEFVSAQIGRPPHLLEKDIWLVWTLSVIYQSNIASQLTFKGGTSLSKAFGIIDRFSEDIDLTYDIRALVPDLLREKSPIPETSSQERKISKAVRQRLPEWIETTIKPMLEQALERDGLNASLVQDDDKLLLAYPAVKTGIGYSAPVIKLEFGARATGEPHVVRPVVCDMSPVLKDILFPAASPLVMDVERTFWEKATAAHVYCLQGRLRGDRYARHWYDLAEISKTAYFEAACQDQALATAVAEHKSVFFTEKDSAGDRVDYSAAVNGQLQLIPVGESFVALERDYQAMLQDGLLSDGAPDFVTIMEQCRMIQSVANKRIQP